MIAGTDVIAKGLLLPYIHKQLAGHARAEDQIQQLHGHKALIPDGDGSHEAHAQLALGHLHLLGHRFLAAVPESGLGRKRRRTPIQTGEELLHRRGHSFRFPRAHIEDIHPALPEDLFIVAVQRRRGNGRHIFLLAQPGNAKAVRPAQQPQHLIVGVDPLVVALGIDGGHEILFLALHKILAEDPILQGRLQQQLPDKIHHGLQNGIPIQGKPILHKAAEEAGGLVIAHPADGGAHGGAVKLVQAVGDAADIAVSPAAPEQYRRQQGIIGRLLPVHGPDELEAQGRLLEPLIAEAPQGDPRK